MGIFDKLLNKKSDKICLGCNTKLGADDLFCSKCGKKYETTISCPSCHASIVVGSSFCTKCGKPVNGTSKNTELDYSREFDFYANEVTRAGDLKGNFQINGKKCNGVIIKKAIDSFGWDAYQKIGIPIRCSIFKLASDSDRGAPLYLLHVEQPNYIHRKELSVPSGIFQFTATDVSNKKALLGRVTVNGVEYKGSIQNSDLPSGIIANDLIGMTFAVVVKSPLQDKVAGEPFYPLLIKDSVSVVEENRNEEVKEEKFVPDESITFEEKIQKALIDLEEEDCFYFQEIDDKQIKSLDDVIQSLPADNRDYALNIQRKIKRAMFDLKENSDGPNITKLIESVKYEGITYLEKEKQLNTFLAGIYFEINDVENLKEYLKKEIYNNFGFYFASSLHENELKRIFAKKHIISDKYLPHLDKAIVFVGVCEFLRTNDYAFLQEIEKINDKESYNAILRFLLRANGISYDNLKGLSKAEEFRYLYGLALNTFFPNQKVENKKIVFNSDLSAESYMFIPDDVSQLGASLGKVKVNGVFYKGSIQKSDLPQGKSAWQLIGSQFPVFLKGDLQTGQPGGDYYKLTPKDFHLTNNTIPIVQAFPLYAQAHDLKFKKNKPSEAKAFYISSIRDEREKQKRVSSVPDLISIFIQEGNYEDAIAYLTQYKSDIRPQAFDSFMNTIAIKQGRKSDYVPTTSTEYPLYDLAHQTLFDFKQRDEAIVRYREAIHAGQNIGASVAELITVLIQNQDFDECADLLVRYGKDMKPTAYENQKKQVLSFRPDLEAKISGNVQVTKKTNLQMAIEACDIKDFDKAIMYYEAAIQEKENLNQAVPELIQLYLKFGLDSMAESIYMDHQKKLEEENKKFVLKTFYSHYLKTGNEIKKEEIGSIYQSHFNESIHENEEPETRNSSLEYSDKNLDYFKEKVIACSLPMGRFRGDYIESTAIDLQEKFDNFIFKCSKDDIYYNKERIKNYLPEDKVLMKLKMQKGYINSKKESLTDNDERKYVAALVNAILFFGDNPSDSFNSDFSRYCYKKVVSIFSDNSNELSVYWAVALFSYFETFNNNDHSWSQEISKSEVKFDNEETCREKLNGLEELFNSITNIDGIDFFISTISIVECVNKYKSNVLENMYESKFNVLLCNELKSFINDREEIRGFDGFKLAWTKAEKKYDTEKNDFVSSIKHLLEVAKDQSQLSLFQNELQKIEEHSFVKYVGYQDKQYLTKLLSLLKTLNDFYSDDVFEQQRSNLEFVVKQIKELLKAIRAIPTEIFYDALLSDLVGFELTISKVVEAFFQNGKPELDFIIIDEANEDFDKSGNRVLRIPLKIKNKENVQNALKLSIIIQEDSSSFEYNPEWANGQNILSGKSLDNEILFEFPESFDISSDIQFKVSYTFEYYQDFNQTTRSFVVTKLLPPVSISKDDAFILREGQNPYAEYAGGTKPVDKEAMFFGREDLLEKIRDRIENRKTKWICLYGQRRTGKTSIRNHSIKRLAVNERNIIVNLDIELIQNLQGFFFKIIDTLNKEISEKKHPELKKKMISDGKKLDAFAVYNVPSEVSETLFTDTIHDFISYIEEIDSEYKVILFIDEFTRIYDLMQSGELPEALMHWWKRFIENENIIVVTIGQDHMPGFIADPKYNNDFAILTPDDQIIVTTIDDEASKRLIQEPIPLDFNKEPGDYNTRFDTEAIVALQKLTSGNAYLTMTLCSDLADYLISKKRSKVHEGTISILIDEIELKKPISTFATYFDPLFVDKRFDKTRWSAHKEKNIEIMKTIASYTASTEYMPRNKFPEEDQDFITYLVSRKVLEEKDGKVKILVELCQKWLYLHKEDVISYETKDF